MVLLMTPWIRPVKMSRLLFTYLLPIIPLLVLFDGLVSCVRTYSVEELRKLTEGLDGKDFSWEAGEIGGGKSPVPVIYLIGCPEKGDETIAKVPE